MLSLTLASSICLTACVHRTTVLAADRVVVGVKAGEPYTPVSDGYFVPKARMQDLMDRLSEKEIFGTSEK